MALSDDSSDYDVDFFAGNCALALARPDPSDDIRVQKASSCPSVPNEIWCNIWHILALDDRLAVTRVCKEWRRLAHAQRSLWNRLDFRTSRHQRNCLCNRCNLVGDLSYSFDPDAKDWLWEVSNLHHAARVLPLSGNLKLHITLEVQVYDALFDELYTLGVTMALHAERITTLSIRTADTAAYYTFLARFESLPNLRSFSGVLMGNNGRRPYGASFVPAALQVPELQTVRLKGFDFPTARIGRTFPTVRNIAIAPVMSIFAEVSQALAACPTLDEFALDLHAFERPAPSDDTETALPHRASALRAVSVSGILLEFEQWVLEALDDPSLQTLALEYDSPHEISLAWSIFASLSGPVTLRVNLRSHWPEYDYPASDSVFSMQIEDSNRRTRRVVLHRCALAEAQAALANLGAMQLHKIVAPYALWPLVRGALSPHALDVAKLVVTAYDAEDQAAIGAEDQELVLRALTIVYDGPGTLSLPAARVEQLVLRTRVRIPLDVLTLDSRLATSVPDRLARTVVVTSCPLPDFALPAPLRDKPRYESEPAEDDSDLGESD